LQGQLVEHHEPDAVDEGDSNLADCGDFNKFAVNDVICSCKGRLSRID